MASVKTKHTDFIKHNGPRDKKAIFRSKMINRMGHQIITHIKLPHGVFFSKGSKPTFIAGAFSASDALRPYN